MKSFSILRTNVALTTNVKIIIDSNYNLFLESIESSPELESSGLKKKRFNKDNFFDELLPYYWNGVPTEISYLVKNLGDVDTMYSEFSNQYDNTYFMGAQNIQNNKGYVEEYEYFAPLYIFPHSIPKYFIIFRVDGPGIMNSSSENFRQSFLSKFKVVKIFNLTDQTPLGEWINRNFTENKNFPPAPLDVDFKKLEFTRWWGIDYETGGYTYKPLYLENTYSKENSIYDFEKIFTNGWKLNKVIFPNILNFSFLFDDSPSTPTDYRKWSINRYSGFYVDDMVSFDTITLFTPNELKSGVIIDSGNILTTQSGGNPFIENLDDMWVEFGGNFYRVIKFVETGGDIVSGLQGSSNSVVIEEINPEIIVKYKIISDLDLTGLESQLNLKTKSIDQFGNILNPDGSPYIVDNFDFADVNLIKIGDQYHNLILNDLGGIKIHTDGDFQTISGEFFSYRVASNIEYSIGLDIRKNNPIGFEIFRVRFTDIKDFDTQVIDNDFSKFEYELRNQLTQTEETKMYFSDLRTNTNPPLYDDFIFGGESKMVPVSSDYTSNLETFRISNNKLTTLWNKNPDYCRWGYQNSISVGDRPYLLNVSGIHEQWNRTSDVDSPYPDRVSRNLDYFYTLNSGTTSYLHHSLHVERNINADFQDTSFVFELDKYLELGTYSFTGITYTQPFDYFSLLFDGNQDFMNGEVKKSIEKYSYFNRGDESIPNTTLFRGLEFRIFEVDSIDLDTESIKNINVFNNNTFNDWKFSILLSSNDWMIGDSGSLYKPYNWGYYIDNIDQMGNLAILESYSTNQTWATGSVIEIDPSPIWTNSQLIATPSNVTGWGPLQGGGWGFITDKIYQPKDNIESGIWREKMQWRPIHKWELDKEFKGSDLVIWEDTIYRSMSDNIIENPTESPSNSPNYTIFQTTPFWDYITTYNDGDFVWRDGDWYSYNLNGTFNFWRPDLSYSVGDLVIWSGRFWECIQTPPIGIRPVQNIKKKRSIIFWKETTSPNGVPYWDKILLWSESLNSIFCIFGDSVYKKLPLSQQNTPPIDLIDWELVYSLSPNSDYIYSPTNNPVILIGDVYFWCEYNPGLTLDNGITIYINKKWKNILINISINDNTISSISGIHSDSTRNRERDNLYLIENSRLTANNFIRQINDIDTLYGFSDWTSYVIIEEDGSFKKYNWKNNIEKIPYLLVCEGPDKFGVKESITYTPVNINFNILKANRELVGGNIDNIERLEFYNKNPLGVIIDSLDFDEYSDRNYNGQNLEIFRDFWRFSGWYMPIFYDIEMFGGSYLYQTESFCEVQFVLSVDDVTNIILEIQNGDLIDSIELQINPPIGNDWVEFYNQIIDIINESEIFNGIDFIFEIIDIGSQNIHSQILDGYPVLSIKYKSDSCSVKVSATEIPNPIVCDPEVSGITFETNISGITFYFYLDYIGGNNGQPSFLSQVLTSSGGLFEYRVLFDGTQWIFEFIDVNLTQTPVLITTSQDLLGTWGGDGNFVYCGQIGDFVCMTLVDTNLSQTGSGNLITLTQVEIGNNYGWATFDNYSLIWDFNQSIWNIEVNGEFITIPGNSQSPTFGTYNTPSGIEVTITYGNCPIIIN
jgi:hypothetical protein